MRQRHTPCSHMNPVASLASFLWAWGGCVGGRGGGTGQGVGGGSEEGRVGESTAGGGGHSRGAICGYPRLVVRCCSLHHACFNEVGSNRCTVCSSISMPTTAPTLMPSTTMTPSSTAHRAAVTPPPPPSRPPSKPTKASLSPPHLSLLLGGTFAVVEQGALEAVGLCSRQALLRGDTAACVVAGVNGCCEWFPEDFGGEKRGVWVYVCVRGLAEESTGCSCCSEW
jgi:hypothetical protein